MNWKIYNKTTKKYLKPSFEFPIQAYNYIQKRLQGSKAFEIKRKL